MRLKKLKPCTVKASNYLGNWIIADNNGGVSLIFIHYLFSGSFSEAMEIAKQGIEWIGSWVYTGPWILNPFSLIATHLGHYDEAKAYGK